MRDTDVKATTHGFRSTFRDWAGDMTNFPREVCEQALAHVIADETEAAYLSPVGRFGEAAACPHCGLKPDIAPGPKTYTFCNIACRRRPLRRFETSG
jgi:hypothetical protein